MRLRIESADPTESYTRRLYDAGLDRALGIIRVNGYRLLEGQALTVLAGVHHDRGHVELASRAVANALAIHLETGHRPGVERCRRLLPT